MELIGRNKGIKQRNMEEVEEIIYSIMPASYSSEYEDRFRFKSETEYNMPTLYIMNILSVPINIRFTFV